MTTWTLILLFFANIGSRDGITSTTISQFPDVDACVVAGERAQKLLADPRIGKIRYACVKVGHQ